MDGIDKYIALKIKKLRTSQTVSY